MNSPVVVGIDGSPESLAAADWAGDEAVRRGAPVRLLNVWRNPVSDARFFPDPEGLRFWAETRVQEAGKRLADRHPGLTVTAAQVHGTAVAELLGAAAGARVLVLGSRGYGDLAGFFHGSVGLHLAARAQCPVVTVRAVGPAPGEGGGTVVLGLDPDGPCEDLISFACEEAAASNAALRAVHVWDERRLYGHAAPALDPHLAAELKAESARALSRTLAPWRAGYPHLSWEERLVEGPVARCLLDAARDEGRALLVLGRRREHPMGPRLGPVAHAMLHHAACPVAVVPHD